MTVHTEGRPGTVAACSTGAADGVHTSLPQPTGARPQTTTVKVLAVLLAVVTGTAAALAANIVGCRVTKDLAEPIVWAAATFAGATSLVLLLEEKIGLLE